MIQIKEICSNKNEQRIHSSLEDRPLGMKDPVTGDQEEQL